MAWVVWCHAAWVCSVVQASTRSSMVRGGPGGTKPSMSWSSGWTTGWTRLEGIPVILGLPYLDVAQPGLGAVGEVRDQAGRALRADAVLDAGVDLRGDRHLVGECVRRDADDGDRRARWRGARHRLRLTRPQARAGQAPHRDRDLWQQPGRPR